MVSRTGNRRGKGRDVRVLSEERVRHGLVRDNAEARLPQAWTSELRRGVRTPACTGFAPSAGAWACRAKRAADVVVAGAVLVLAAPLIALIALLIVLDSPGPVLFRVDRVGFRGRPLRMLKFRKMHARARGAALTGRHDARLTRTGAFLARTRLDELPQLWHVLRGEMSLVGPRPEHFGFVVRHPNEYSRILSVRPGLTGLSQLAFASESELLATDDPIEHYVTALLPQKVALDRLYAARWTPLHDLEIVLATLAMLLLRQPIAVDRGGARLTLRRRPGQS